MPLTLTPLTPLSLSPPLLQAMGEGGTREARGGGGTIPLDDAGDKKVPTPAKQATCSARLSEFGLSSYFASEGGLREGGLSEYPFALRSPSEAKYGAKKGKFERGSDPLHRGSKRGAGGREGEASCLCLFSLPSPAHHSADFLLAEGESRGKVEFGEKARPPRVRKPPANGQPDPQRRKIGGRFSLRRRLKAGGGGQSSPSPSPLPLPATL